MSEREISRDLEVRAASEGAVVVIPKNPLASRTNWFNAIGALAAVIAAFAGSDLIKAYPEMAATLVAFAAGINVFLRSITTAPVSFSKPSVSKPVKVFTSFLIVVLAGLVCSQTLFAQEAAPAKPAIIKLTPSAASNAQPSTIVQSANREGVLGRRILTIRRAEGLGFSVRAIKAAVADLKASEDLENQIVEGETTAAEASVLVVEKIRGNQSQENEAISDLDWGAIFAFVEKILRLFGLI